MAIYTKPLDLGGLSLPIEAMTQTLAVLGIRDSGKTNTAVVYAEELLKAGQQVLVIDPTDVWWGLKSSRDGTRAGFPVVVLGGRHADLPLASQDGALIADFIVEHGVSVVCSLRHFEHKSEEHRFVAALLRRLYFLKGQQDAPTPIAIIIDEASREMPQIVRGEDAHVVGAVQQIVRQGRSSGFGVMLIDQRAASVNKDVLDMLEMLVMHRTTGPRDRKALRDWIEGHDTEERGKTFLASLASLKRGEAWFWSPTLDLFERAIVRQRETFDSSRTPRAGEVVLKPKAIAEVDLDALREKLSATIEAQRANDAAELRKEIAELRKRADRNERSDELLQHSLLADASEEAFARGQNELREALLREVDALRFTLHQEIVDNVIGQLPRISEAIAKAQGQLDLARELVGNVISAAREIDRQLDASPANDLAVATELAQQELRRLSPAPRAIATTIGTERSSPRSVPPADGVARRSKDVPQLLLDAHAWLQRVGYPAPNRAMLAAFCHYHPRTPAFTAPLKELIEQGLLREEDKGTTLTDRGAKRAKLVGQLTSRQIYDRWLDVLNVTQRRIIEVLRAGAMPRTKLAEQLDYHPRTPAFTAPLKWLYQVGLVRKAGGNEEIIEAALFGSTRR